MELKIEFKGIPIRVVGEYEKGEDRVMYYDNLDGYPGSNSSFYIHSVYVEDSEIDLIELFSPADLEKLETKILEQI